MPLINGLAELDSFRKDWTGEKLLSLVRSFSSVLIEWAVGVGKSHAADSLIEAAVVNNAFDLVVFLAPTRRILNERKWIVTPPADIKIINLKPRPRKRCGKLDADWLRCEAADAGALGRQRLCGGCKHRSRCSWPKQYSAKGLTGSRVIFGTQAHLHRSPNFISQITRWVGATRVLVILDEIDFAMATFRRRIKQIQLLNFIETLQSFSGDATHRRVLHIARTLSQATTDDLRAPGWRAPPFTPKWAARVQEHGLERYGTDFRFLGYDLQALGASPLDSRQRAANHDTIFSVLPRAGTHFAILSATARPALASLRLGCELERPFMDYRFTHPDTTWFNIATNRAARRYFVKNSPQILDFFAQLCARRMHEGRRVVLLAKKMFVDFCAAEMQSRLRDHGFPDARVIAGEWEKSDLTQIENVPLIHYGLIGVNLFEHYDCIYALSSYFVNEDVINTVLQDLQAEDFHLPVAIRCSGTPRRRTAGATNRRHHGYDVHALAQDALDQKEMDVVLQAVGRVRPFTRPREIITMQCSAHPYGDYAEEFTSLAEARNFFGVGDRHALRAADIERRVREMRAAGNSQSQTVKKTRLSLSTVKRYWNTGLVSQTL